MQSTWCQYNCYFQSTYPNICLIQASVSLFFAIINSQGPEWYFCHHKNAKDSICDSCDVLFFLERKKRAARLLRLLENRPTTIPIKPEKRKCSEWKAGWYMGFVTILCWSIIHHNMIDIKWGSYKWMYCTILLWILCSIYFKSGNEICQKMAFIFKQKKDKLKQSFTKCDIFMKS